MLRRAIDSVKGKHHAKLDDGSLEKKRRELFKLASSQNMRSPDLCGPFQLFLLLCLVKETSGT